MAADHRGTGRSGAFGATFEDTPQQRRSHFVGGESDYVKDRERAGAHRIHIAQRVCRGDTAKFVCVIDHRGEEIDGVHYRQIGAHTVDAGVVAVLDSHQQTRVVCPGYAPKYLG